jgi:ATP-binding cassette subfamily B protein
VAFVNYLLSTMGPLIMMTNLANVWANGIASAMRINEVLDVVPEVRMNPGARDLPEPFHGWVEFRNVSFHYNGATDQTVLDGIDLTAEPGQTVAILGATGAGKTSLVNLIPRFYDVTGGEVLIDGVDVRELNQAALLSHVAIVPQESILFTGSIRDNIRYGYPEASDEEVREAARAAQIHEYIESLPNGYETRVEERGVNLSGGQKQRIALARAMVTRTAILILDDSTSAVDVETETLIQEALARIPGQTRFVVAQRISTVLTADQILVLDRGRIAARGKHAELLRSSSIYQEIYSSQLGEGIGVDAGRDLA